MRGRGRGRDAPLLVLELLRHGEAVEQVRLEHVTNFDVSLPEHRTAFFEQATMGERREYMCIWVRF